MTFNQLIPIESFITKNYLLWDTLSRRSELQIFYKEESLLSFDSSERANFRGGKEIYEGVFVSFYLLVSPLNDCIPMSEGRERERVQLIFPFSIFFSYPAIFFSPFIFSLLFPPLLFPSFFFFLHLLISHI